MKRPEEQKLQLDRKGVDALIQSLEARGAAHHVTEAAQEPPPPAEPVARTSPLVANGSGERMSDEDLEEFALVLKMTRSAMNARRCGLRLLEETRRARAAEARLLEEAVPAALTVRRSPAA